MLIDVHTHNKTVSNPAAIINLYDNFETAAEFAKCSLGLHPWFLQDAEMKMVSLQKYASLKNAVAIGECGLDKLCDTDWNLQVSIFNQQIELANALQKPLMVHCVRAYEECMQQLAQSRVPVVFHGFNRNWHIAEKLLSRGFYLSFGQKICDQKYASTFSKMPLQQLFLETDDAPIAIADLYKRATELLNISLETFTLQIEKNYKAVFENGG